MTGLIILGWGIVIGYLLSEGGIRFLAWTDTRRDIEEPTTKYAEVESCEGTVYFRTPAGNWQRDDDFIQRPWSHLGVRRVRGKGRAS